MGRIVDLLYLIPATVAVDIDSGEIVEAVSSTELLQPETDENGRCALNWPHGGPSDEEIAAAVRIAEHTKAG